MAPTIHDPHDHSFDGCMCRVCCAFHDDVKLAADVALDALEESREYDHDKLVTHANDVYRDLYGHRMAKSNATSRSSTYSWEWYRGERVGTLHRSEWHAVCIFCRCSVYSSAGGKINTEQRERVEEHADKCALLWLAGRLKLVFPRRGYKI